ncbi:MAG: ubiquinone/menaquinone biosynthesis methyltransferase [Candidatus Marsarchaeota archaeon]|jgi:demethylmenaquinone methyltransferase/2-methoxy-6-polyprenyl-1,4-benzoquinol methylase|nr:ubiquinone/menaquinone biosynthesis methyltransferase [Candidatus Marsarchaeota archaeon]
MSMRINNIFSRISGSYDAMNHILSLGVDIRWRNSAVSEISSKLNGIKEARVLDIATGTGDLALAILRGLTGKGTDARVVGMDFNKDMLDIARKKAKKSHAKIRFEYGDALHTRYPNEHFDMLASGFAIRNFDDLDRFSKESYRILKRKGGFVFVDMAMPDAKLPGYFFYAYSVFMRFAGFFVDNESYKWLVHSIKVFDKKELERKLRSAGFINVHYRELWPGMAYIITGEKR